MAMKSINYMAIAGDNLKALKAAKDGDRLPYASYQKIVLIGLGHDPEINDFVLSFARKGANLGSIRFTRGEGKSGNRGTLTVDNFRGKDVEKQLFVDEIRKVSDKTVVFI